MLRFILSNHQISFKISVINRFLLMLSAGKMSLHQKARYSGSSDLQLDHTPSYALKSKGGPSFYKHHCFAKYCGTESALTWNDLKERTDPLIIPYKLNVNNILFASIISHHLREKKKNILFCGIFSFKLTIDKSF